MAGRRGGPPLNGCGPAHQDEATATTLNATNDSELSCVCDLRDQRCTCEFYADWATWPTSPNEPVAQQLRRRRAAAQRSPRLACGRRDPISRGWW
jgi:hypothetical protein